MLFSAGILHLFPLKDNSPFNQGCVKFTSFGTQLLTAKGK